MPSQVNSFRGIRPSKFRHVYGKAARKENCYENVLITQKTHDTAACAANPKFIAIVVEVAGGGAFIVLPLDKTGRIEVATPKVTGHSGPVYDIKWCPFNDNLIASASDDCTVKLWHIPDGGLRCPMTEPLLDLQGHQRRVTHIEWHPTVDGVLFSVGHDFLILVWDVNHGVILQTIDVHQDIIYSLSVNRDGSKIVTTCRDKKLRIIEPRSGKILQEGVCHEGPKACKAVYLGDLGKVLTTGFSRFSDRQWAVWDDRKISSPLKLDNIDSSSGILTPYYDHDTRLIFIAGKGDGNIRYYEITDTHPYCHYLSQYISSEPQRGFGAMPKRGCKVYQCEVYRFYKLLATKSYCEPISMIVPRKSETFQPDIYPDTASPTAALSVEEWLSGIDKGPVLMSLKTGMTIKTHRPVPMRPGDASSDKYAEKKIAFLSQETRADYRPLESRPQSTSDKDLKTSTNLDTKFQQLQKIWGCSVKNMPSSNESASGKDNIRDSVKVEQDNRLVSHTATNIRKIDIRAYEESPKNLNTMKFQDEKADIGILDKPSPKNEIELRRAYTAQCEELKLLRRQLVSKDRRIRELEDIINQIKTTK